MKTKTLRSLAALCAWLCTMQLANAQALSCCENNILKNADFEDGVSSGGGSFSGCLPSGGTSVTDWCGLSSPQYYLAAPTNSYGVAMWGIGTNFTAGEGIYQAATVQAAHVYTVSFRAFFRDQIPTGPDSIIFRFRAYPAAPSSIADPTGTLIGEYVVKNTSPGVFTLPKWTAPSNFGYVAVTVHNGSLINDGQYVSWATIDNICMSDSGGMVNIDPYAGDPQGLTVFPNPTEQTVWVNYPAHWGKMTTWNLFDLNGRAVNSPLLRNQPGNCEWDLSSLADGVYFLNVSFSEQPKGITQKIVKE